MQHVHRYHAMSHRYLAGAVLCCVVLCYAVLVQLAPRWLYMSARVAAVSLFVCVCCLLLLVVLL